MCLSYVRNLLTNSCNNGLLMFRGWYRLIWCNYVDVFRWLILCKYEWSNAPWVIRLAGKTFCIVSMQTVCRYKINRRGEMHCRSRTQYMSKYSIMKGHGHYIERSRPIMYRDDRRDLLPVQQLVDHNARDGDLEGVHRVTPSEQRETHAIARPPRWSGPTAPCQGNAVGRLMHDGITHSLGC